ncbi:MAG: HAD family hydrolase [Candidatus Cloacimonetes bacterium]|nr:HAD family hydrolase [Candidatus Cloacimonadota bacterium]
MKAVFIDRDGTINHDPSGYIASIKDFHLYPYTAEAIKIFNKLDFKTIVVSNQSGIARGLFTEDDLKSLHQFMKDELAKEGAFLDLILYSPFHPGGIVEPYNVEHFSRKPRSGMFFEALKTFPIKAKQSYMIGDKDIDIEFGKNNGMVSFLVTPSLTNDTSAFSILNNTILPDFIVSNILSAAKVIKVLERQKNG